MNLEGVTVTAAADKVSASTNHGITLTCYKEDSDICTISWADSGRNGTVGLLGTSNYDAYSDRRVPDGSIADDWDDLLPHYVVSGPAVCHTPKKPATVGASCSVNAEVNSLCWDLFQSTGASYEYFLDSLPFKVFLISHFQF